MQEGRQPDLTLWFDLPPEVAAQRLAAARQPDRFERLDLDFFTRVAAGYAARAAEQPQRFLRIDADQTPEGRGRAALVQALEALGW